MRAPSGDQFEIAAAGYTAVVTEGGAALRSLTRAGHPLIDGFPQESMASGGRGQILMPWPNRIRDGRYSFGGADHQLALTEPSRHNASHGLVRWVSWHLAERSESAVTLRHRLMAQTGYPWTLDLQITYALSADGLSVTQAATNRSDRPAPYASGAHPYLSVGTGPVDTWELTLPATVRALSDPERLLPTGTESVTDSPLDFREPRPIGDTEFNHAYGELERDADGVATTRVVDPGTGRGVELWVDSAHPWLMVYSADDVAATARRSLAVEPMTANVDAFNSGLDVTTLAASGEDGDHWSATWGIRDVTAEGVRGG